VSEVEFTAPVVLTDELLDEIARRAARLIAEHQSSPPWLNTKQAAEYIAAKPGRIHDLVQLGKLHPRRDGKRLLFKPSDLDDYLERQQ
jgi:excisionase family DNA binding protein